jgi:phosphoadenosine phosphosulfate reductase
MQLTFENKTIDQLAIELIQAYEPPEGYYLGFSGGKDSVVIYDLAKRSGVKFSAHYSVSPIDPPQIHQFIKEQYPDVKWDILAKGFFGTIVPKKGFPYRHMRWCCEIIKEGGGEGQEKILGTRRAESIKRSKYKCYNPERHNLLPIIDWSDTDVWQYIAERNLEVCSLYREGFKRIGCVLCPFSSKEEVKLSLVKFPKIVNCWKLAGERYLATRRIDPKRRPVSFATGEEYFNWWIKR